MIFVVLPGNALHDHVLRRTVAPSEVALTGMGRPALQEYLSVGCLYKFHRVAKWECEEC